jgi:methylthioribose-1-phosphate isomerase
MSTLEAIKYNNGKLELLDQLKLPFITEYLNITSVEDGWHAIRDMKVRGAPAIAIAGVLSVAVELHKREFESIAQIKQFTADSLDYLVTSRPTAVNMADAAQKLNTYLDRLEKEENMTLSYKVRLLEKMRSMLDEDIAVNKRIGDFGAQDILTKLRENSNSNSSSNANILTICNTGSLATAGYGTALGVVRRLKELGSLNHCYCTETRPYNQGSRLTAYELVYEQIPSTLICDNMVGILMSKKNISAVVVGADRVVANGDTANKIGTYQLAILAKYHSVPFYVAVPTTSIDLTKRSGAEIAIEERPSNEMTHVKDIRIAAEGINCWNPCFDVTPAELITGGLITEYGVFRPEELEPRIKELANL